jgi:hypothetical protein
MAKPNGLVLDELAGPGSPEGGVKLAPLIGAATLGRPGTNRLDHQAGLSGLHVGMSSAAASVLARADSFRECFLAIWVDVPVRPTGGSGGFTRLPW